MRATGRVLTGRVPKQHAGRRYGRRAQTTTRNKTTQHIIHDTLRFKCFRADTMETFKIKRKICDEETLPKSTLSPIKHTRGQQHKLLKDG